MKRGGGITGWSGAQTYSRVQKYWDSEFVF
jgi:hypothetical protein